MVKLRWKEVSVLQSQPGTDTKWIRSVSGIRSKAQDHCHPVGECTAVPGICRFLVGGL